VKYNFLVNKRGNIMPYVVVLIAFVAMPMMMLSVEITRAMYVNAQLQTATDAACAAAVQALDTAQFIETGLLQVDISQGRNFAQREFTTTLLDQGLNKYQAVLLSVNRLTDSIVGCEASAVIDWVLPGFPDLTLTTSSTSSAQAIQ